LQALATRLDSKQARIEIAVKSAGAPKPIDSQAGSATFFGATWRHALQSLPICALPLHEIAAAAWMNMPDKGRRLDFDGRQDPGAKDDASTDRVLKVRKSFCDSDSTSEMSQILPAAINFFRDSGETRNGSNLPDWIAVKRE
jgi:hypothetical protein